jgi:DNA-directed RNA polymerase subunit M/transcription elongation factor TFIIS
MLQKFLNKQNSKIIDTIILSQSNSDEEYKNSTLQVIGRIINLKQANGGKMDSTAIKQLIQSINKQEFMWNDPFFDPIRHVDDEEFKINLEDVVEGVWTCKKCGCKKTFSYQKQTRSADEGSTSFIVCLNGKCGAQWRSYA